MLSSIVDRFKSIMQKPSEEIKPKNGPAPVVIHDEDTKRLKEAIYDQMRTIQDPEKPVTLEDLDVVYEEGVVVRRNFDSTLYQVDIEFSPTVPHCSLASLIGLCIREKLQRNLTERMKLRIFVKEGSHSAGSDVNKQINDKERVAAALENPSLLEVVERCIKDE